MNYTSASININSSIETQDFSILTVLLVFTYMNSSSIRKRSSSSSSKVMLVIAVLVISIIIFLLDRSSTE